MTLYLRPSELSQPSPYFLHMVYEGKVWMSRGSLKKTYYQLKSNLRVMRWNITLLKTSFTKASPYNLHGGHVSVVTYVFLGSHILEHLKSYNLPIISHTFFTRLKSGGRGGQSRFSINWLMTDTCDVRLYIILLKESHQISSLHFHNNHVAMVINVFSWYCSLGIMNFYNLLSNISLIRSIDVKSGGWGGHLRKFSRKCDVRWYIILLKFFH